MQLLAKKITESAATQIYLSRPDLVQKYIDDGWEVFEVRDDGSEIQITNPDSLPENCQQSSISEAIQALDIIMNGG